jgi:hypothetical protein
MAEDLDRSTKSILGDINPNPSAREHADRQAPPNQGATENEPAEQSMDGGSRQDRSRHAGSRDITEGTTGAAEVGGTRNYRTGSGAAGSDIGNRPE